MPASTHYPNSWLWTTRRGTITAWVILMSLISFAWAIKFGGLRSSGLMSQEWVRWVLGWAPSFVVALGLPFAFPALGWRLSREGPYPPLLAECRFVAFALTLGELSDLLLPQVGNSARQYFALSDLIAILTGATCAYYLPRLLNRR
ncbi:MAG: hypothetical protein AAGD38_18655 [Acidobacteriota bacterium]